MASGYYFNNHQKKRFAKIIVNDLYKSVSSKTITFFGWAFKKDTNDTRESAAIYIADYLLDEMAIINVYDPKVKDFQIHNDLISLGDKSKINNKWLTFLMTPI